MIITTQNTAERNQRTVTRDMKITRDPVTQYPVLEKQGYWIVLRKSMMWSELPQLYDWLDSDDYEDLFKLPEMFSGVECVMKKPQKVVN